MTAGMRVTKIIYFAQLFSQFFGIIKTPFIDITDGCRRSYGPVAPVKYECVSKNLSGTFCKTEDFPDEEIS